MKKNYDGLTPYDEKTAYPDEKMIYRDEKTAYPDEKMIYRDVQSFFIPLFFLIIVNSGHGPILLKQKKTHLL